MGNLDTDTAVRQTGDGSFIATLSSDWEIWGPNGGYLASVAMRAAGVAAQRSRPASINAHFVGAGYSGDVDITTIVNRSTRVATSVTVNVKQGDRPIMTAIVWGVDDDLAGLEHQSNAIPDVTFDPEPLSSTSDRMEAAGQPSHAFWSNLDVRPLDWIDDWENRGPSEPSVASWTRFVPATHFSDPWVDAARSLILIDLDAWPAGTRPHVGDLAHFAPTIEVTARFVGDTSHEPWLLCRSHTPRAADGLLVATAEVWTRDRQLVAIALKPAMMVGDRRVGGKIDGIHELVAIAAAERAEVEQRGKQDHAVE